MDRSITMKKLIAVLISAFLFMGAGPTNSPINLQSPSYPKQTPVEQQSDYPWNFFDNDCSANVRCVINPTPCGWDVDDFWGVGSFGYLAAKTSASVSFCEIADYNPVFLSLNGMEGTWSGVRARTGVEVIAPSPNLIVTITYQPQGKTFTLIPIEDGRKWNYLWCANVVYEPNDPALQPIPGSGRGTNGQEGLGVREDITVTITNPTNKQIKGMSVGVARTGTSDVGYGCTGTVYFEPEHVDYPFRWWGLTK